jgi:hypothetical protein
LQGAGHGAGQHGLAAHGFGQHGGGHGLGHGSQHGLSQQQPVNTNAVATKATIDVNIFFITILLLLLFGLEKILKTYARNLKNGHFHLCLCTTVCWGI